nr:hypothetical protein CFP56_49892 [Quercus suber]
MVPGFYEARKKDGARKNSQATRKAPLPSGGVRANVTHVNKEVENVTEDADAKSVETFDAPDISKLKPFVVFNEDSNGNKGNVIEEQIREIDKEFNSVDISGSNLREAATNQQEVYVGSASSDKAINLSVGAKIGLEAAAGHVVHLSSQTLESQEKEQLETYISHESRACIGGSSMRTWTRIVRAAQRVNDGCMEEGVLSSK